MNKCTVSFQMTTIIRIVLLWFVSLVGHAVGQEFPALVPRSGQTVFSNDGKLRVEFDPAEHPEVHIWVSSADKPTDRNPVGGTFFYVQDVSISPGGNWIVVKDGTASAGTHLAVFRRTEALQYKEAGGVDPEAALKMLEQGGKLPKNFGAAHLHSTFIGWLNEDVGSFVFRISGDGGAGGKQTNYFAWFGTYDSTKSKISGLNEKILTPFR